MKKTEYFFRKKRRKYDIKILRELNYSDDEIEKYIYSSWYNLAIRAYLKKNPDIIAQIKEIEND